MRFGNSGENQMNSLILALQFLTRIPIPIASEFNEKEAAKSLFWFPWISFFTGLFVGWVHAISFEKSPLLSAFFALLVLYGFNGGIHLDGLMDTADGFLAGRGRKEIVRIMHDSKIGTYAILSLIFVLLGNFSVFASVPIGPFEMAILSVSARMGVLTAIYFFPTSEDSRLGDLFKRRADKKNYILAWGFLVVLIFLSKSSQLLIFPCIATLFSVLFSRYSVKKIGGVSGDVYGAIMEIGQCLLILCYGGFYTWLFI